MWDNYCIPCVTYIYEDEFWDLLMPIPGHQCHIWSMPFIHVSHFQTLAHIGFGTFHRSVELQIYQGYLLPRYTNHTMPYMLERALHTLSLMYAVLHMSSQCRQVSSVHPQPINFRSSPSWCSKINRLLKTDILWVSFHYHSEYQMIPLHSSFLS